VDSSVWQQEFADVLALIPHDKLVVELDEQTLLSNGLRVVPRVPDEAVESVEDMLATTAFVGLEPGAHSEVTADVHEYPSQLLELVENPVLS